MAASPDPQVAPDSPAPSAWRRPLLNITGLSLLSLGAILNADRLELESRDEVAESEIEEEAPPPEQEVELVFHGRIDEFVGGNGQRHKGEEGKMGKPSSKSKSGLYSMKGPKNAVPQMARNFDPEASAGQ